MAEHRIRRNRNAAEVDQHQFGFLTAEYDRFWHPRDPRVIAAYICPLSTLFTHRALQPVRIPTRPSVGSKNGSNRKDGDMSRSGVALSGGVDHYLLWLSTWLIAGYRGVRADKGNWPPWNDWAPVAGNDRQIQQHPLGTFEMYARVGNILLSLLGPAFTQRENPWDRLCCLGVRTRATLMLLA